MDPRYFQFAPVPAYVNPRWSGAGGAAQTNQLARVVPSRFFSSGSTGVGFIKPIGFAQGFKAAPQYTKNLVQLG